MLLHTAVYVHTSVFRQLSNATNWFETGNLFPPHQASERKIIHRTCWEMCVHLNCFVPDSLWLCQMMEKGDGNGTIKL